jgi:ATP-binding cassette, subfamily C, bacterial CydD
MYLQRNLLRLARYARAPIAVSTGIGLAVTATRVVQALLLVHIVVAVIKGKPLGELTPWFAGIGAVILARAALLWLGELAGAHIAHVTKRRIRESLFRKLLDLGPGYLTLHRSGEVRGTLVDGVEQLETYNARYLPVLIQCAIAPPAILAYLLTVEPVFAAIAVAGAVFSLLAPALFISWYRDRSALVWSELGTFDAEFVDTVQGLPTLKSFGATAGRRARLAELAERVRRICMAQLRIGLLHNSLQKLGTLGGTAAVLIVAAFLYVRGDLDPFGAVLAVFLIGEVFRPLDELSGRTHDAMGAPGPANRIEELLSAAPPAPAPRDPRPFDGEPVVEFDRVTFSYPARDAPAVNQVSFTARPGAKLAVVGPSGSGKTTLVQLLLRFFDPDEGTVRIGGRDVRELAPERLRELVAVVAQDTYLFHGTIGENIALGRPGATPAEVREAAAAAGVADFSEALPGGYDTPVGERGLQVSGGQRQRIAIARAVLKDAPILVLDEATSAVDAASESAIAEALEAVARGRTTITIAHRLSTVRDADEIVVLADGGVAERGTHESLHTKAGLYSDLIGADR